MKKLFKRIFNPDGKQKMSLEDDIMNDLILKNAIQFSGVDEKGDILYSFTPKIKEIMPDLYEHHLNYVNLEIMNLWQKGFLEIDLMSQDPVVRLSNKAFTEDIQSLSDEEKSSLNEIKRVLLKL